MPVTDSVINDILKREGPPSNDPIDKGGATAFGISKVSNPEAWKNGPPTQEQARNIYIQKYVNGPGFHQIEDKQLQAQLVDFGVNSGPAVAIQKLQDILKVTVDGVLGPETLKVLKTLHPDDANNLLVAARIRMICKIVQRDPSQLKFLLGWCNRALEFSV